MEKSKTKILFYGNCQTQALTQFIQNTNYDLEFIECFTTDISRHEMLNSINSSDIIITQPISDYYRDLDYLSIKFLYENKKDDTQFIVFPSLFCGVYFPDLIIENKPPCDYHYTNLKNYFTNKKTPTEFISECVNYDKLISTSDILNNADSAIQKLKNKETEFTTRNYDCLFIPMADYIENNWKEKLLFYAINHASKHLFHVILNEIQNKLNLDLNVNYEIDPQYHGQRCIIYECVNSVLNFDNKNYQPRIKFLNSGECVDGTDNVVNQYYKAYNT